jgi:hypothetical protein
MVPADDVVAPPTALTVDGLNARNAGVDVWRGSTSGGWEMSPVT